MLDQLVDEATYRQNLKSKPFKKGANSSPVKRLISMKERSLKANQAMDKAARYEPRTYSSNRDTYQIRYVCNPDKATFVRPEHEIDYDLADRNPKKFMNSVYNQEVH
jgi:hypothetical protein